MSNNAPINVSSASENWLEVDGVVNRLGVYQDTSNTTLYVTVIDSGGTTLLTRQSLAYQTPGGAVGQGTWGAVVLASYWVRGNGPWDCVFEAFDQSGSTGAVRRTWHVKAYDREFN